MKYCPYCGAILMDSAVSFCAECGKALLDTQEKEQSKPVIVEGEPKKKKHKRRIPKLEHKRKKPPKQRLENNANEESIPDDGYDGYYDDIKPVDAGRQKEGLDKQLLQRVTMLVVGLLLVVGTCVAIMYLL